MRRAPLAPSGLVDASGRSISRFEVARARASASSRSSFAAGDGFEPMFEAGESKGMFLSDWAPALRSADKDWLPARNTATARTRHLVRNDPVGQAGVERKKNAVVGRGWRIKFRPNAQLLGIDHETARKLGTALSNEFQAYA